MGHASERWQMFGYFQLQAAAVAAFLIAVSGRHTKSEAALWASENWQGC